MSNRAKFFFLILLFVASAFFLAKPVRAVPWVLPWSMPATTVSTLISKTPSAALTYTLSPRQFTVSARGVKNISYTITYQRTGGKLTEALTGGGRTSNGVYIKRIYAGSQSSHYFIPHNVLSGHFQFDAITTIGGNFSVAHDFVIRRS